MIEQVRIKNGLLFLVEDYSYELKHYDGEPFLGLDGEEVTFLNEYEEDGSFLWYGELSKGQQWLKDNIKPERIDTRTRTKIFGNEGIVDTTSFYKNL